MDKEQLALMSTLVAPVQSPTPSILMVSSSEPVAFSFTESVLLQEPKKSEEISLTGTVALGISTIHDGHLQSFTAQGDEIQPLLHYLQTIHHKAELWAFSFYDELPLERSDIQPFSFPFRGQPALFMQQGNLADIYDHQRFPIGDFTPTSCTDAGRAFSVILERLRRLWAEVSPDQETKLALIADYAGRLGRLGPHNFMLWEEGVLHVYNRLLTGNPDTTEDETPKPLVFSQSEKTKMSFSVEPQFTLTLAAKSPVKFVVVRSSESQGPVELKSPFELNMKSELMADVQDIPQGAVISFAKGEEISRCEPVSFWEPNNE